MFIESSKDILFLVLAFCALWFTAFVCWALYYVITILRDASHVVGEIHDKIAAIERAVHTVREKVEASLGSFGVVAAGMRMVGEYMAKRKDKVMAKAQDAARETAKDIKKKASKVKRRLVKKLEDIEDESEDLM